MPNLEPVVVPEGKCNSDRNEIGCPYVDYTGDEHEQICNATGTYTKWKRPDNCPLGTQAAIRWVPEVEGEVTK